MAVITGDDLWSLEVLDDGPPATVMVWEGQQPRFRVRGSAQSAIVTVPDQPDEPLLLFLRACWDDFTDAGWPAQSWFLNDCPRCGADSFEPCRAQSGRLTKPAGASMRTIHRERYARSGPATR